MKGIRILAAVLCIVLCAGMVMPAYAQKGQTTVNETLLNAGVPQGEIQKMPQAQRIILSSKLEGKRFTYANSEEKLIHLEKGEGALQRGSISGATLKMSLIFLNSYKNDMVGEVMVIAGYEWLKNPMVCNFDIVSMDWDSSLFQMVNKDDEMEFETYSVYDYYTGSGYEQMAINQHTRPTISRQGSVGWEYELPRLPAELHVREIAGCAFIMFKPRDEIKRNSNSPTCDFNFNYAYNRTPIYPLHLSFSTSGGIIRAAMDGGWFVDTAAMAAGYTAN